MSIDKTPLDSYQNPALKTTRDQLKDLARIADSGKWYKIEEGEIREADRVNFIARFFKFFTSGTQQNYAQLAEKFKNLISRAIHEISNEKDEDKKQEMNANLDKIIKKLDKIHAFSELKKNVKVPVTNPAQSVPNTPQTNPRSNASIALSSISTPTVSFENINPNQSMEDAKMLYQNHQFNRRLEDLRQHLEELQGRKIILIEEHTRLRFRENRGENVDDKINKNEDEFRQLQQAREVLIQDLNLLNAEERRFKPNTSALQKEQEVRMPKYLEMMRRLNGLV